MLRINLYKGSALLLMIICILITIQGVIHTVYLPEPQFLNNVIIDDAFYYLIPAQNLLAGRGYTFDGIHRTNGVQPLWALISIIIAAFTHDRLLSLRWMVFASGITWLIAGLLLFISLRNKHWGLAALASTGWIFTGFWNRNAFMGMENSSSGLALSVIVWVICRYLYTKDVLANKRSLQFYFLLILSSILVGFARVEQALLVGIVGFFILIDRSTISLKTRFLIVLFPPIIAFGSYIAINFTYFGNLLPVSGSVKRFYEGQWISQMGYPSGGLFTNIIDHVKLVYRLAFQALTDAPERFTGALRTSINLSSWLDILVIAILISGFLLSLTSLARVRREDTIVKRYALWLSLGLFAVTHFLLMATLLPHFTGYGIWYFAIEIMMAWLAFSSSTLLILRAISKLFGHESWLEWAPLILTTFLLFSNVNYRKGIDVINDLEYNTLVKAGIWLNKNIPAQENIGSLSSGYVGYYSHLHRMYNLDGLMNDQNYFVNYLKEGKLRDYLLHQNIHYLSDYQPIQSWDSGFSWGGGVPLSQLELLKWWLFDDYAYGIWRFLPNGAPKDLSKPCTGICDKVSQIQFASAVLGKYPLIADQDLEKYLQGNPGGRVVTSIASYRSETLNHVIMTDAEYRALGIKLSDLIIDNKIDVIFDQTVQLVGFDVNTWDIYQGGIFQFTRYWRTLKSPIEGTALKIITSVGQGDVSGLKLVDTGCHDTWPLNEWTKGDIISETYSLVISPEMRPGVYPVLVGIENEEGNLLSVNTRSTPNVTPGYFLVGNIFIHSLK